MPTTTTSNLLPFLYMSAGVENQFCNPVKLWRNNANEMQASHLIPLLIHFPFPSLLFSCSLTGAELKAVAIRGHCNVIQRCFIDYDGSLTWHGSIYTSDLIPRKWNPFMRMLARLNKLCWFMTCLQWWSFPAWRKWTRMDQKQVLDILTRSMMLYC